MIYKEHYIELYVNGQKLDLESQKSLNLRFQSVLYDPTKISSTQAEYSFEIELPSTQINDKIFDYANNLSKLNKFHSKWNAEVYADGTIIFEGMLTLNGFKNGMYNCNLVSIKVYSLEEIFGDATLTDIPWEVPFDGAGTSGYSIDYYNSQLETDVVFPFVSYGAFQKSPKSKDSVGGTYTSKFDLDKYNRWYVESFYPSLNMLATIKKAFEYKGYTVAGDAFQNVFLRDIYMSTNLADGQSPEYNLGNPKFGKVKLTVNWTNPLDSTADFLPTTYGINQDLKYPYFKSGPYYFDCTSDECTGVDPDYNFKEVKIYDMMSSSDGGNVTMNQESAYMYQPNEHLIVIPADGFYKIKLEYSANLLTTTPITATQWVHDWNGRVTAMTLSVSEEDITFNPDLKVTTPLEIQLVKNYDDNLELIKGKNNILIHDGYPDNTTEMNKGRYANYTNVVSCFPHEAPGTTYGYGYAITEYNDLDKTPSDSSHGYIQGDNDLMCYDPAISDIFIAGATSMGNKLGGGTAAVRKNGYSWSKSYSEKNDGFYNQPGYYITNITGQTITSSQTEHNSNEYIDAPQSFHYQSGNRMNGVIYCMVELKKNDVIKLLGVHRAYGDTSGHSVTYQTSATVELTIEAASPNSYGNLKSRDYGYYSNPDFTYNLRLSNFLNKDKKISEWVQNIVDAYNLEVIQDGKSVFLNSKKKFNRATPSAIGIDDRVNSANVESEAIDYPSSMAVRYKIDTEEWGFEKSVTPPEKLNDPDWKDFGDSGFTVIKLNDDEYVTNKSDKNLQFSYTWYDNFNWYPVDSDFNQSEGARPVTLKIPVISKFTYMIDGYDYDESMKHDGYGLSQRFWFRPKASTCQVWTRTYPPEMVTLYTPVNLWTNYRDIYLNLSYKTTEPSLLQEYFNITPYLASNYVNVEVYLSPEEYKMIKNGSMIHLDSDLYYPVEISGYDCSGNNPTELKMIKKV